MIRDTEASNLFPSHLEDDCLKAYQQGQEDQSALTMKEVRVDGARKAKWTFEREQPDSH